MYAQTPCDIMISGHRHRWLQGSQDRGPSWDSWDNSLPGAPTPGQSRVIKKFRPYNPRLWWNWFMPSANSWDQSIQQDRFAVCSCAPNSAWWAPVVTWMCLAPGLRKNRLEVVAVFIMMAAILSIGHTLIRVIRSNLRSRISNSQNTSKSAALVFLVFLEASIRVVPCPQWNKLGS